MRKLLLDVMAATQEPPPLCRRIREERERLDISQEKAAQLVHLSLAGYRAYERHREPKPSRAREIAVAFGLPADHFESYRPSALDPTEADQVAALRGELAEQLASVREELQHLRHDLRTRDAKAADSLERALAQVAAMLDERGGRPTAKERK